MRVKSDARFLINQRRLKKPSSVIHKRVSAGLVDARKILNLKKKTGGLNRGKFQRLQTVAISGNAIQRPFNKKVNFSNLTRIIPSKSLPGSSNVPEKRVKLARDGNILVTARSKDTVVSVPQWTPSNVDTVDVEHIGIDDVIDMDSLPNAVMGSKLPRRMLGRTLAEEIVDMPHTMIADQVASNQQTVSVVVSNLHASVSRQDIMELFGDVGLIKKAEMVQPGVAVIEFYDSTDAAKACDLYHNRLLDGLPMQCSLQPLTPTRSIVTQRLGARIQTESSLPLVSPAPSSSRSMYNPRNVRFTVKLT